MSETEESSPKPERAPGRTWTERYTGPIRYRRYTGKDAGNRPYIFFKIEEPVGSSKLADEVYAVFQELKVLDARPGHPKNPTGLTFNRDRIHGRVYKVSDDPTGRTVADIIDARLSKIVERIDQEQCQLP